MALCSGTSRLSCKFHYCVKRFNAHTARIIVATADGLATMLVAIFWRIVSFKFTNLVERVGLLTLIIIGEGIIGMVKSVSCITKSQGSNNGTEIGTVVAGVLLLVCPISLSCRSALTNPLLVPHLDAIF